MAFILRIFTDGKMKRYRKPHRLKKKRPFWKNQIFWLGILILIIFGGIFYLIFFHSFFQVKEIQISDNLTVASARPDGREVLFSEIQKAVKEKISQKILFFSSRSIFLANFNEIKKEILKKFPQIEEIDLKRKFPDKILIQIVERKPVAIFCPTQPADGYLNCFSIDKEGIVFESAQRKPDLFRLKKEIDREINLGEKIIEEEELSKILEVEWKLKKELKIPVEEILIISEDRFNAKTFEGWEIYFNPEKDINWQLTKLKAVLEGNYLPKEYIDLRFGDRAFVK